MKRTMQLLISASALCILACAAGAQQAPPPKTDPAKPKAKRVWTNDDVTTLRQPSDVYQEEKRQQAEAAAKASQKAPASQSPGDPQKAKTKDYLPKTLEEAEKLSAAKQYEIGQQHESIDRAKQEQAEATSDEARAAFQKRIDSFIATLDESIAEMHALDTRLQELKANPPPPRPAALAAASSSGDIADLEKQIAEQREKIEHYSEYVQPLRDAIDKADSETVRAPLQKKLDGFLALIDKQNAELKTLESQLQELKAKPPAPPKP